MAELVAVRTIFLIALFTSDTFAGWTAHEATVELLPNDIVPHGSATEPLTSVITSPQKVIEGQVESVVDTIRRSLEEVQQSVNPKGKRNVGAAMPPLFQVLLLFITVMTKLNQINGLASGHGIPNQPLAVANGLTGVVPPGAIHVAHATLGNPATNIGLTNSVVPSPTVLQNSLGHSNVVTGGIVPDTRVPVVENVKDAGLVVPVVGDSASNLPVGLPNHGAIPTGTLTNDAVPVAYGVL